MRRVLLVNVNMALFILYHLSFHRRRVVQTIEHHGANVQLARSEQHQLGRPYTAR